MEIVVVGCRGFGRVHLRSIRGADIGIVERDAKIRKEIEDKFPVAHSYETYEQALESSAEIIDLAVPHNLHRDMAIAAMKKGKHVTLEKPISTSLEESREMIDFSRKAGVKFMVLEQYYFDPSVQEAKRAMESRKIGTVHTIIVRDQRVYEKEGWRATKNTMGGGALIDGGIHYVDTMLNLGGVYDTVAARSVHGGSSLQGEDNTVAMFSFKSGATGILYYSWAYRNPPDVPGLEIIGSNGSIYEDPATRSHEDFKMPSRITAFGDLVMNGKRMNIPKYDVFQKEFESFIESVEKDTDVPFDPELAYRDLSAVLDIYRQSVS
ncbi:MAG: Gfo/Idh/MocA family oxidoreductase [Thermoplasmataceae archaeon]